MRALMMWLAAAGMVCLAAGCPKPGGDEGAKKAAGQPRTVLTPVLPADEETVLEAETLTLKGCEAKDLAGASGGRIVLFNKEGDQAKGSVTLKKGKYEVTAYVQGHATAEDAVYVTVSGGSRQRIYADEHGKIVPASVMDSAGTSFKVTVAEDGPCAVTFEFAEKNVYVDRVVFKRTD